MDCRRSSWESSKALHNPHPTPTPLPPQLGPPTRGRPPAQPMLTLAPPHLALAVAAGSGAGGRFARMHATYVAFGNRGDKVRATASPGLSTALLLLLVSFVGQRRHFGQGWSQGRVCGAQELVDPQ